MLLRKLLVALAPLILCAVVCIALRWADGMLGANGFWSFVCKGALLGAALAFVLPLAGIGAHTNGLTGWLFVGAGVLSSVVLYQYSEVVGVLHVPVLQAAFPANGQVLMMESAVCVYMTCVGLWYRQK